MANRTVRSRFPQRTRRQTDWALGLHFAAPVNIPANSKVLLTAFNPVTLTNHAPGTIVRTRGIVSIVTDNAGASEEQFGGLGCRFVSATAAALGVTALPGPVSDFLDDEWFVLESFIQQTQLATAVGEVRGRQYIIDSKAMRKFGSDVALVVMAENGHATEAFQLGIALRFLIKAG